MKEMRYDMTIRSNGKNKFVHGERFVSHVHIRQNQTSEMSLFLINLFVLLAPITTCSNNSFFIKLEVRLNLKIKTTINVNKILNQYHKLDSYEYIITT
jgi:hypothetical protein